MELLIEIIGWIGSIAVVVGFASNSYGWLASYSIFYQGLNILGSICLIIHTIAHYAYPPAAVNIIWLGIALVAIFRKPKIKKVV